MFDQSPNAGGTKRKSRLVATFLAILVFFVMSVVSPRESRAAITDGLLISAYVAGGVAAIAIIAILFAPRDEEPDFLEFAPGATKAKPAAATSGLPFRAACRMPDGSVATVCW